MSWVSNNASEQSGVSWFRGLHTAWLRNAFKNRSDTLSYGGISFQTLQSHDFGMSFIVWRMLSYARGVIGPTGLFISSNYMFGDLLFGSHALAISCFDFHIIIQMLNRHLTVSRCSVRTFTIYIILTFFLQNRKLNQMRFSFLSIQELNKNVFFLKGRVTIG